MWRMGIELSRFQEQLPYLPVLTRYVLWLHRTDFILTVHYRRMGKNWKGDGWAGVQLEVLYKAASWMIRETSRLGWLYSVPVHKNVFFVHRHLGGQEPLQIGKSSLV